MQTNFMSVQPEPIDTELPKEQHLGGAKDNHELIARVYLSMRGCKSTRTCNNFA